MNRSPRRMRSDVGIVEDAVHAGQPQRCAGDADVRSGACGALAAGVDLESLVQEIGEELAEFHRSGRRRPAAGWPRRCRQSRRCSAGARRTARQPPRPRAGDCVGRTVACAGCRHRPGPGFADAETRGVQSAERQVQRCGIADPRMVGKQGNDAFAFAQHILDKAVENPLRAHLDKNARAGVVERIQPFDELDRRGDLFPEQLDHLGNDARAHRDKTRR